jgi:hypothetical protein
MNPCAFRRFHLLTIIFCWAGAVVHGVAAEDHIPAALTQSEFVKVTTSEFLNVWQALGNNFTSPEERWPMCDVTIQDGKLAVLVRRLTYLETQEWRPQKVSFNTDMTHINKRFKEPTHMMRVGEDWLCAYAYGEFGNRCWLFFNAGKTKALLTKNEIVTLATIKGRYFATTYDSEKYAFDFSELVPGRNPELKPLNVFQFSISGLLRILPSPDKETLFLITQNTLARWNVTTNTSIAMCVPDQCFAYLASDAHSSCEAEGRFWIGGPGFVCSIDPTAADLALQIFVPKDWLSGAK